MIFLSVISYVADSAHEFREAKHANNYLLLHRWIVG